MDFLSGKKTLVINVLMVLAAALGAVGETGWVSAQVMVYAISIVNIALRFLTTGPQTIIPGGSSCRRWWRWPWSCFPAARCRGRVR